MEEALYQVVITGKALAPFSRGQAVMAFAQLFSISPEEAEARFRQAPCAVRGRLSHELALKYHRVMRRQGIACRLDLDEEQPECLLYPRLGEAR